MAQLSGEAKIWPSQSHRVVGLGSAAEEQLELILEPAALRVSILCFIIKITPTVDWKQSETELLSPSDRN